MSRYNGSVEYAHAKPHGPFSALSSLADFFSEASRQPYPTLPAELHDTWGVGPKLFETTLKPKFPICFAMLYLLVISIFNHKQDGKDRMKGKIWKGLILSHNLSLATYSGWTFYRMAPATVKYYFKGWKMGGVQALVHCFCDSSYSLWDGHLATLAFLFYLSKFWEIFDSLILVGKGKRASLLQEYHHAGAMLTMWSAYRFSAAAVWLFVVFNSGIHTIMYSYYTTSVLKLPFPMFLKRSLTKLQITQFLVGGSLAVSYLYIHLPIPNSIDNGGSSFWWPTLPINSESIARFGQQVEGKCLRTQGQRLAVWMNVAYLLPLTVLFARFYVNSYRVKSNQVKSIKTM